MQLPNSGNQSGQHPLFSSDGTITAGGTSQRILARAISRSFLFVQNLSASSPLYLEIGDARASCTISNGGVASFTVLNGGFGYTRPPSVFLSGGWNQNNTAMVASGSVNYPAPPHPAVAHAVLTGGVVTSIVIDDPGLLYTTAPSVHLIGDNLDPHGVADPYFNSVNSGLLLPPNGGNLYVNGTSCPTGPVSIWGGTTGIPFTCRWMA